jgi:hypothetical protein
MPSTRVAGEKKIAVADGGSLPRAELSAENPLRYSFKICRRGAHAGMLICHTGAA